MQVFNRQFSAYESAQLRRHGLSEAEARAQGAKPVEYLTGHVDFAGLDLLVDQNVLIPRVETEELVDTVAQFITSHFIGQVPQIAEIGTGSGAISLALAQKLIAQHQNFSMTASDISQSALKIAQQNQERCFKPKTTLQTLAFLKSDVWQAYPPLIFDVVIANLPYIPNSRLCKLDSSVIDFEPVLALDGGPDGLDIIRTLIRGSLPFLRPRADLFLEIDETHTIEQLVAIDPRFKVKLIEDQFQKNRFAELELNTY